MTPALLALAVSLAASSPPPSPGPCAPPAALAPDPAAAEAYRAVAETELARGDVDTAAVAYREAAARDPGDAGSREALARLCADGDRPDPFAEGIARLEAGDPAGALRSLRAAQRGGAPPPAVALLEGICHYDLGEDEAAEPLLRAAEAAPAHRDTARLYLGLLRLRAGDARDAAALFDAAGTGPSLALVAGDLGRLARREGPLVLSLLAESAWDSNVTLAPADETPGPEGDASAGLTASALWRPRGTSGPYARAAAGLAQQLSLGAYDVSALDGAVGWQERFRTLTVAAEYDLGARTLGGARYLTAQRLLASAVWTRGGAALSASYAARFEDYASAYQAYSGVVHRGELRLSLPLGDAARVSVAYGGARDLADARSLSYTEHGPRAELRVALGGRLRLGLEAGAAFRSYDAFDAALGDTRRDTLLDAAALAELDLGDHLTARVALQGRVATSSVPALEYDKLVPSVGLLWVGGF